MNYIITKNPNYFKKIGNFHFCDLKDMILPEIIAFDSETTGLKPLFDDIFCVQIGTSVHNYIIHMYDDNYEFEDLVPYINNKVLVGHNITFDLGFCYKYGFFPKKVKDTMLASMILYNGDKLINRHDFGSVMHRELGIVYDKTDQKNINTVKLSQVSTIEYSFNDVDRLLELHEFLEDKLRLKGMFKTYNLHCKFIRVLAYIEQCGLPISPEKWKAKMLVDSNNQLIFKQEVIDYIYDNLPQYRDTQIDMFDTLKRITVMLTSSKQMIKVFNDFGIETKDKDGKDSIEENIISKSKHEFVKLWLKFQNANHRVTTFGDKIYKKIIDNRLYTNFKPLVDTARLATRRGEINFLNFPKDEYTRDCFTANEGNDMIVCDWSGQETVIAADLSGDEAMTDSVLNDSCLHCAFARVLFPEIENLSDAEIKKQHKDKRESAKSPRFAFQYGGSAFTIHQNEGIPLSDCYVIENSFKALHSGLYTWGAEEFKKAVPLGYIESADGWRLKLPKYDLFLEYQKEIKSMTESDWTKYKLGKVENASLQDDEKYKIKDEEAYKFYKKMKFPVSRYAKLRSEYQRLCLNNPVQSRGAHQLKLALVLLFEWIEKNNYYWKVKIVNAVHDEIVLESEKQYSEEAKVALEKAMVDGGNHYLTTLQMKADANIGTSWKEAK